MTAEEKREGRATRAVRPRRPILVANKVSVRYGRKEPWRLIEFSGYLRQGEILSVVGESGAGKSSLLGAIAGFAPLSTGTMVVCGHDLHDPDVPLASVRSSLGLILQQPRPSLDPAQSALDAVAEPLVHLKGARQTIAEEQAARLLEALGVDESKWLRRPAGLSGGECQRVSVARALVHRPPLVLADEPTANLDPMNGDLLVRKMKTLAVSYGLSMVYVTHHLREAADLGGQVAVLLGGILVESIRSFNSWEQARHPYTRYLVQSLTKPVEPFDSARTGCPFAALCPQSEPRCQSILPPEVNLGVGHTARCFAL